MDLSFHLFVSVKLQRELTVFLGLERATSPILKDVQQQRETTTMK